MEYLFYLSYARSDLDSYLRKFFADLSRRIRNLEGTSSHESVGFFDQHDIEGESEWEIMIADALRKSLTMVSLCSPAYFNSEYCGKEWEIFRRRWQLYVRNSREVILPRASSPVIKPVVWIPSRHVPMVAAELQNVVGDHRSDYYKEGLKHLRKQYESYGHYEYDDSIHQLANDILATSREIVLPSPDPLPALSQVKSAFYLSEVPDEERQSPSTVDSSGFPDVERQSQITSEERTSRIFISYRRGDGSGYAGRLSDRLADHFGMDRVFMDIDTIEPGDDFVEAITNAVKASTVLIALINKQWINATDGNGQRRLNKPDDFVALEISTALKNNIRVIPILVQGASMPQPRDLPKALSNLAYRNAFEISDLRWKNDVSRLIEYLEKLVPVEH